MAFGKQNITMKHVFSVTSHLTFFIAKKTIEKRQLCNDDCILLLLRDYTIPPAYNNLYATVSTSYNVDAKKGRVFAGANFVKTSNNIKEFDSRIDPLLNNEDFIWYTSVCSNDICSLMVTKPNCKGFYVTEDGFASYRDFNPQTFIGWRYLFYRLFLKPLWPRIFSAKNHFISSDHPKYLGCIATSKICFPLHQNNLITIGSPFETIDLGFVPDALLSIDPLFLFLSDDKVIDIYSQLSNIIKKKGYNLMAYKYHPVFLSEANKEHKEKYNKIIRDSFGNDIVELDKSVVLENVLQTYKCDFYTDNSSVAIYGSVTGAKCYTYIPILKGYVPSEILKAQYAIPTALIDIYKPVVEE